jgi:hypothetical protein
MDSVWNGMKYDNIDKIRDVCVKKLQDAFDIHIGDEIKHKFYEKAGGFRKFRRDFKCLKEEYERSVYGFKREEVSDFLCSPKNFGGAYSRRVVRPTVSPSVRTYVPNSCPVHNLII